MPRNTRSSWSFGLGLLSMVLVVLFWPAAPPVAVAAIVLGVLGVRDARQLDDDGRGRALVGIGYAAIALLVLVVILYVSFTSDLAAP